MLAKKKGFTLLELMLTMAIVVIMVGALVVLKNPFERRQKLEFSAVKLMGDLRQAQQFSRAERTDPDEEHGYRYHGLRFYGGLGPDGDRVGWKILRFCTDTEPDGDCDEDPSLPIDGTTFFEIVKSSELTDGPELIENTFFEKNVTIAGGSDLGVGDTIVFVYEGSATQDGDLGNLLDGNTDDITLSAYGNTIIVHITPLTGHVRIQQ